MQFNCYNDNKLLSFPKSSIEKSKSKSYSKIISQGTGHAHRRAERASSKYATDKYLEICFAI